MRVFAAISTIVCLAGTAHAGPFGGFATDDKRYLKGGTQICAPVPAGLETAAPRCQKADAAAIAAAKFRKPKPLTGATAPFRASAAGTRLNVTSTVGKPFAWSSVDPIVQVNAVYLSSTSSLLAVEFQTRMGSRVVEDVIVFRLAQAELARAAASAAATAARTATKRSKTLEAAIAAGHKQLKRKRWAAAEKAFRAALAEADDPEARYGAAVALARRGKAVQALTDLEAIAASGDPAAAVWKVAARHHRAFRKLVADKRFRAAVGIDRAPGAALSAYERLVGATRKWEQSEIKCDRARINIHFRRRPQTFKLTVTSTCGGYRDRTRLSGSWTATGANRVELTMPNPGGKPEVFACTLDPARDGTGEDQLTCGAGTDMEMALRTVRR